MQVTALAADWADELSDILLATGAEAVTLEEHRPPGAPEQEIFDDGTRRLWQSCTLVAHFPLDVRRFLCASFDVHAYHQAPVQQSMADIEASSGRSLQYTMQPVATAQWSEAVKVRLRPAALHTALDASRRMLVHGTTPGAVVLTLTLACANLLDAKVVDHHESFALPQDTRHECIKIQYTPHMYPRVITQASYQPISVTEELIIVPAWQEVPPPSERGPTPTPLILEPGLAFGTGDHPTTQLCLRWLLRQRGAGLLAKASVVDYGCGMYKKTLHVWPAQVLLSVERRRLLTDC